jgi:hypothetical protein
MVIALVVAAASFAPPRASASATLGGTYISGGALPYEVRLAPADEDAFMRRLSPPPRLSEPPETTGRAYTVRSPYWSQLMPGTPGVRGPAGESATYYPEGGYLSAARTDGTTTWLVLDVRQQAILARYVSLGERGLLPSRPAALEVIRASVETGEQVGIQVGGHVLSEEQSARFWRQSIGLPVLPPPGLERLVPRETPVAVAPLAVGDLPVTLTLAEGRSLHFIYRAQAGRLEDTLGYETYGLSPGWLASVLGQDMGSATFGTVPQDEGPGSPLWWLAAMAAAALLLAAAARLGRAPRRTSGQST